MAVSGKHMTVKVYTNHLLQKCIQYHAPPIVLGHLLMDAQWCTKKFKRKWTRYKLANRSSLIFQMLPNPDNMMEDDGPHRYLFIPIKVDTIAV